MVTSLIPNEWWALWEPLRYAGIALGIGLMAWGLLPRIRDVLQGHKIEQKSIWLLAIGICAIIVPPWVLVIESFRSPGFNPSWPDAIQCKLELPEFNGPAPFVFYYLGTQKGIRSLSDVARYFLVSGNGYTHELWFVADPNKNSNKPLIRRVKDRSGDLALQIGKDGQIISKGDLDGYGQGYLQHFPDVSEHPVDCGGDTIRDISSSGNAFVFARRR